MSRASNLFALVALSAAAQFSPALAAEDHAAFMSRFSGAWLGTGEFLVGTEAGAKFSCELNGNPSRSRLSIGMQGRCWMGVISAPVHARLRYNAETDHFYGEFMDGGDGNGADIMGARSGDALSLKLSRGGLQGRLAAQSVNADQMTVTIYYRDRAADRELAVVAMGFTRKDTLPTLPDYKSGLITGESSGIE